MKKVLLSLLLIGNLALADSNVPTESYISLRSNGISFGTKVKHNTHLILPLPTYCSEYVSEKLQNPPIFTNTITSAQSPNDFLNTFITITSERVQASQLYNDYKYHLEQCLHKHRRENALVSCKPITTESIGYQMLPLTDEEKVREFNFIEMLAKEHNYKSCLTFQEDRIYTETYKITPYQQIRN